MLDSRTIEPTQVIPCVDKRKALDFSWRYAAMRKSGGQCPYCGVDLEFEHEHGARVAFDHVIPLSRGGAHDLSNMVACCFSCNAEKHAKTGLEYLCERMGIAVHWFASFNPELDGFSAPDDGLDLYDQAAWFSSYGEICDGEDAAAENDIGLEEVERQLVLRYQRDWLYLSEADDV